MGLFNFMREIKPKKIEIKECEWNPERKEFYDGFYVFSNRFIQNHVIVQDFSRITEIAKFMDNKGFKSLALTENESVENLPTNIMAGKILCTSRDQKWIQLRNDGLLVTQESGKGIISKKLSTINGLASQTVNCFAEDHTGTIWIGTSQGLSVCYFPDNIFTNSSYSAESILIETDAGYVEKLF